jgi:acyl-CoA synthetase (NDP forming)
MLGQCGAKGVPYVIIFSSGFSEMGGEGVKLQQQLAEIARRYDIGVIGPNCQGMMNVADGVFAGFGSVFFTDYEPGRVSMVSQSGGFGFSVMNLSSKDGGLPFRQMVTTGNEIGVSTLEFMDYFIRDSHTDIIAGYLEGAKRAMPEIGQKALAAGNPILCGRSATRSRGRKRRPRIPPTSAARWRFTRRLSGRTASSRSRMSRTWWITAVPSAPAGCPGATASRSSPSPAAPGY